MNIIVIVVFTSRRDLGFTVCWFDRRFVSILLRGDSSIDWLFLSSG